MAQRRAPVSAGSLEAVIQERTGADDVPGLSIAVVKGDRVVWERGFGFADLATSTPATPATSYLWFSMTKIVTATAVMRLVEVELAAPADEYFRGFKVVSRPTPVTVRHLLNHSSGLANPLPIRWVRPADAPAPERSAFVGRLLARNRRLKSMPGERASYSNLGYLVLGEVVSEVTGTDCETYVRDEILLPLGMERTAFSYPRPAGDGATTGYQPLPKPLTPLLRAALPRGVVGPRYGRYASFEPSTSRARPTGDWSEASTRQPSSLSCTSTAVRPTARGLLSAGSVAEMRRVTPRGAGGTSGSAGSAPAGPRGGVRLSSSTSAAGPASGT